MVNGKPKVPPFSIVQSGHLEGRSGFKFEGEIITETRPFVEYWVPWKCYTCQTRGRVALYLPDPQSRRIEEVRAEAVPQDHRRHGDCRAKLVASAQATVSRAGLCYDGKPYPSGQWMDETLATRGTRDR